MWFSKTSFRLKLFKKKVNQRISVGDYQPNWNVLLLALIGFFTNPHSSKILTLPQVVERNTTRMMDASLVIFVIWIHWKHLNKAAAGDQQRMWIIGKPDSLSGKKKSTYWLALIIEVNMDTPSSIRAIQQLLQSIQELKLQRTRSISSRKGWLISPSVFTGTGR